MKKLIDCDSRNKLNREVIQILCQYCAIPESDKLFLSRLMRTLSLVNKLLSLDQHYNELLNIKDNMLKAGQNLNDRDVIKFSAALNTAIDIISNQQNGCDDLLGSLSIVAQQLNDKIDVVNKGNPSNNINGSFSTAKNSNP